MNILHLPLTIQIRVWGSFINRISSSAILPFIALYLTQEIGKQFAGTFLGAIVLVIFISNIISGYICDRFGRKRVLNIFSFFESFFILILLISVYLHNINLFLIGYSFYILCATFKRPALTALVQDAVTKENKKLVYRLDYWLTNLSLAIGATMGGLLYKDHKILLFAILFVTSVLLTALYIIFIKESKKGKYKIIHKNPILDFYHNYKEVVRDKRYVMLVLGGAFILSAELSTSSYVAVRLSENFTPINIQGVSIDGIRMFSIINLINTSLVIFFTFLIGYIVEISNTRKIFIFGLFIYTLGYTTLMFANVFLLIIISIIIATVGELIFHPIKNSEQLDFVPKNKRGSYASFSSIGYTLSDSIAKAVLLCSAFLNPLVISLFMFIVMCTGSILLVKSIFDFSRYPTYNSKNTEDQSKPIFK